LNLVTKTVSFTFEVINVGQDLVNSAGDGFVGVPLEVINEGLDFSSLFLEIVVGLVNILEIPGNFTGLLLQFVELLKHVGILSGGLLGLSNKILVQLQLLSELIPLISEVIKLSIQLLSLLVSFIKSGELISVDKIISFLKKSIHVVVKSIKFLKLGLDIVEHLEENISDVFDLRGTDFSFLELRDGLNNFLKFVVVVIDLILNLLDLVSQFLSSVHQLLEVLEELLLLGSRILGGRIVQR
jgi:hypothetical protein